MKTTRTTKSNREKLEIMRAKMEKLARIVAKEEKREKKDVWVNIEQDGSTSKSASREPRKEKGSPSSSGGSKLKRSLRVATRTERTSKQKKVEPSSKKLGKESKSKTKGKEDVKKASKASDKKVSSKEVRSKSISGTRSNEGKKEQSASKKATEVRVHHLSFIPTCRLFACALKS